MNRRAFLRLGAIGSATMLSGCGSWTLGSDDPDGEATSGRTTDGTTPAPQLPYSDRFETVIDAAAAGADPRAGESVVPLVREYAADDTLLFFPEGRYLMDDVVQIREFSNFGIVGRSAAFVPEDGYDSVLFDVGGSDAAEDFLIEGVEFDISAPNTGPRPLSVLAGGDVVVRDVSVTGEQDSGWGMVRVDVTDPDGTGLVERLRLPHGSTYQVGSAGCFVGDEHRGEVRFVDCHIAGFSDNGLYADPKQGSVRVDGGYFANCAVASLRVGDDSHVRGAHVRCDRRPPGFGNMRGLRLRRGTDVVIEDCTVEMVEVSGSDGGIVLADHLESATIRNTTVLVEVDGMNAIRVKNPADEVSGGSNDVRFEDVSVEGTASGGTSIQVNDRDGCVFDGVRVHQSGYDRGGFRFNYTDDAVIRDSVIDVTGPAIVTNNSTVERINVRIPGEQTTEEGEDGEGASRLPRDR